MSWKGDGGWGLGSITVEVEDSWPFCVTDGIGGWGSHHGRHTGSCLCGTHSLMEEAGSRASMAPVCSGKQCDHCKSRVGYKQSRGLESSPCHSWLLACRE